MSHTPSTDRVIDTHNPSGAPLDGITAKTYVSGNAKDVITVTIWATSTNATREVSAIFAIPIPRRNTVPLATPCTARTSAATDRDASLMCGLSVLHGVMATTLRLGTKVPIRSRTRLSVTTCRSPKTGVGSLAWRVEIRLGGP